MPISSTPDSNRPKKAHAKVGEEVVGQAGARVLKGGPRLEIDELLAPDHPVANDIEVDEEFHMVLIGLVARSVEKACGLHLPRTQVAHLDAGVARYVKKRRVDHHGALLIDEAYRQRRDGAVLTATANDGLRTFKRWIQRQGLAFGDVDAKAGVCIGVVDLQAFGSGYGHMRCPGIGGCRSVGNIPCPGLGEELQEYGEVVVTLVPEFL